MEAWRRDDGVVIDDRDPARCPPDRPVDGGAQPERERLEPLCVGAVVDLYRHELAHFTGSEVERPG